MREADSQYVTFTTIPRDEDNTYKDYLADFWEERMLADPHCPDTITSILQITPTQNIDRYLPGWLPLQLGDQLTTFEGYRGFYCRGVHKRTSPWERDFFIYSNLDSTALNTGIGYAELIGPALGHWIDSTEMRQYEEPDPHHYLPIRYRNVNWYSDRIQEHDTCACAIFLQSIDFDSTIADTASLGETWHFDLPYVVPRTVIVGYLYTKYIRYHTPLHFDPTHIDMPYDSLCQMNIAGHEIGHMVDFRHDSADVHSIMYPSISSYTTPQSQYNQTDLDSFPVKPIQ